MNRFFGFIKEKLIEVKQQNQSDLQNIVNAFDSQPYSKQKMLTYLQEIKTNYLEWNILIANEASTGLYFSQIHNKTCVLKKAKTQKESEQKISKNEILLEQMKKTVKELHKIAKLNNEWAQSMSSKVQKLSQSLSEKQKKQALLDEKHQNQQQINQTNRETLVLEQDQAENSKTKPSKEEQEMKHQQKVVQPTAQIVPQQQARDQETKILQ